MEPHSVPVSITFSSNGSSSHAPPWASAWEELRGPVQGPAQVTEALQGRAEGPGTWHMDAGRALGRNTPPLPIPCQAGVAVCGHLPAHSLPCASAALLASERRDGAKSPPLLSRSLPRGARLGRGLPRAWHAAGGLAAGASGLKLLPSRHLPPCPRLQMATRQLLMASCQRTVPEVWLFG